jgi:serine/threonine protein kinase
VAQIPSTGGCYAGLKRVGEKRHPNIVELIATFTFRTPDLLSSQDVYYNLVFPRAAANLEQLLVGDSCTTTIHPMAQDLWSQLEGLTSALAYLHDDCKIAHGDLKPSNILIYDTGTTPALQAKIADFGLALDVVGLGSEPWSVVGRALNPTYNAPKDNTVQNMTKEHTWDLLCCTDVAKLGYIFTELATFLVGGPRKVQERRPINRVVIGQDRKLDLLGDARKVYSRTADSDLLGWLLSLKRLDRSQKVDALLGTLFYMLTSISPCSARVAMEWLHEVRTDTMSTNTANGVKIDKTHIVF